LTLSVPTLDISISYIVSVWLSQLGGHCIMLVRKPPGFALFDAWNIARNSHS
jgi:hypothetical protein